MYIENENQFVIKFLCFTMKTTTILFFALCSALCFGQTKLNYDVLLFNKKIGETTIEKIDKGNGYTLYKLKSQSEAKLLFTSKKSLANAEILVKNGELQTSYYKVVNDDGESWTQAKKMDDVYEIEQNGKKLRIKKVIKNYSVLLYFQEPKTNLVGYFSERLGEFFNLEKIANAEYRSVLRNVTSYYRYINGKLMEVEMSKPLGSVFLKLVH